MAPGDYQFRLVGFPLGHSLSPRLHLAALRALGLSGDYRLMPVPTGSGSREYLGEVLRQVRTGDLSGINITIPYKETILPLLDKLTPVAQATGAVNTVYMENDCLTGDNTDVVGFASDLLDFGLDFDSMPGKALVLGAGGAARAAIYTLSKCGWTVTVAARQLQQAEILASSIKQHILSGMLNPNWLSGGTLSLYGNLFDLIINTTPLGMAPHVDGSPWPHEIPFPSRGVVYDLVYNPPETTFLRQARLAGLGVRNGLGMLVKQAAASFERWTGQRPPLEPMWKSVDEFRLSS